MESHSGLLCQHQSTRGAHTEACFGAFSVDPMGNLTGGTIESIAYEENGVLNYNITGLNLSLKDYPYLDGINQKEVASLILAGNDMIVGGSADDIAEGFTGNDTIDGGAGTDTAIYQSTYASSTIIHNSDGTVTVSSGLIPTFGALVSQPR